jgi:hypothetical protein
MNNTGGCDIVCKAGDDAESIVGFISQWVSENIEMVPCSDGERHWREGKLPKDIIKVDVTCKPGSIPFGCEDYEAKDFRHGTYTLEWHALDHEPETKRSIATYGVYV